MRKRLTAATIESQKNFKVGGLAVDISSKLLGRGASDDEIVKVGKMLKASLGEEKISELHSTIVKIAAESGEKAFDEGDQPNVSETQKYVAEHELNPSASVLDVVLNEKNPTQDPTAAKKTASEEKPEEKSEEKKEPVKAEKEEETEEKTAGLEDLDLDEPEDLGDEDLDDEVLDEELGEEPLEDEFDDSDLDDDLGIEDVEGDDFLDEEEGELDTDDVDELDALNLGEDETDLTASAELQDPPDIEDHDLDQDNREFGEDDFADLQDLGLPSEIKASKSRKAGFKPSRVRVAAGSRDEFEGVFGTPDLGDNFVS